MRKFWIRTLAILFAASLGACAVGPDYRSPDAMATLAVPASFANADQPGVSSEAVATVFWNRFEDPLLTRLVSDGIHGNRDIARALANLQAARAALRLRGYDRYPTVTAQAQQQQRLASADQQPGLSRDQREGEVTDAGFDAIWELDLFGRIRRQTEAERADADGIQARWEDVQVTVAAEIARTYFELRGAQDQLSVARSNAENQRQTLALTRALLEAGRGNELDSSRAEASWRSTLSRIPQLEATEAASIHALSVLVGRAPTALREELREHRDAPTLPAALAISTPEQLLRRRPDIRIAERDLAAATARIGVAVADLFPKVTISGSIGYNASDLSDLGGSASERYGFGPSLSWAAFDIGRVRARVEFAEARSQGALAAYEAAVLGALNETETALVAYGNAQRQRDELRFAAAASTTAAKLAKQRFEAGMTGFVDVLDAERELLALQDALARNRTDTARKLIALYKAIGGGWDGAAGAS